MSWGSFLQLVEIRTKLASVVPFLLGTFYASYHFDQFDITNFILLFLSLLCIDMVTTALNNYYDYKRAIRTHGYNYEWHNVIVRKGIEKRKVVTVIFILLAIAILLGILLVLNTNLMVLMLGGVSFSVAIGYSFGPVPLSRTPLGEFLSGFFMGFMIVFLAAYIHIYHVDIGSLVYKEGILVMELTVMEVLSIFLFSIPTVCCIANIMLANNLCDMEDDIENQRYTLPLYIGKRNALFVFKVLYYIVYIDIMIMVILNIVPALSSIVLLTLLPVQKNIRIFDDEQSKKDTFALSVKNFMWINGLHIILLGIVVFLG